ncbi:MAG: PDDEXK family nuclease, partial [Bellilinea sp.]
MFAQIMDYYGIQWEYEPRTFDLEWDSEGNVTLAFTPDFFLPDQSLYIELTTLRPQLSTRKNKKMRLM